jgi:rhodanese-related sulfurtransferase
MSFMRSIGSLFGSSSGARQVTPLEASSLVAEGKALLVDVREPDEWAETGVAEPALLVPLGLLQGPAAEDLVSKAEGRELIFYCRSGGRSGAAAKAFAQRGLPAANAGGFSDWLSVGLPVRRL